MSLLLFIPVASCSNSIMHNICQKNNIMYRNTLAHSLDHSHHRNSVTVSFLLCRYQLHNERLYLFGYSWPNNILLEKSGFTATLSRRKQSNVH